MIVNRHSFCAHRCEAAAFQINVFYRLAVNARRQLEIKSILKCCHDIAANNIAGLVIGF